jgi:hypothetical protein
MMIVALLGIPTVTFVTLGSVDSYSGSSPNAATWNATLNTTATFGVNIIPLFIVVIASLAIMGIILLKRGIK